MKQVSDLLKVKGSQVWSVETDATVREALELMAEKDVGALLIMRKGEIAGIFSERDFARSAAKEGSLSLDSPVSQLMTSKVITVSPSDEIDTCMGLMTELHIRHLPVLDQGEIAGMVSIGDAVKSIIPHQSSFIRQLEDYISGRW